MYNIPHTSGDPKSFTINVAPQADFPIDLYILMDLTASQQDALDDVRAIIDDIGKYYNITSWLWTLVHAPHNTPNCIYTHTNNQQALKSGHLSNDLDTLV